MRTVRKYFTIWYLAVSAQVTMLFANRLALALFLIGKILRFVMFFVFIFLLFSQTRSLAGYSLDQGIFFYLTFNLVDITGQMLFREVYRFRPQIITGNFDLVLSRPVSPLFRSLLGGADILDFLTLPPLLVLVVIFGYRLHPSFGEVAAYVVLLGNAMIITTAFHIAVLALGIVTTAIDHTVMIYRDIVSMGRIPIDFYHQPVRGILTFAIPVGIMMTLPAKVLMGIFDWHLIIYAVIFSTILLWLSLWYWRWALGNYSSASS